jgi:hypothetical protein
MQNGAVPSKSWSWKEVSSLTCDALKVYLQLQFPEGPGFSSDFVDAHFKGFDGDLLAALQGRDDLLELGMSEENAAYCWKFLKLLKERSRKKRPRIDGRFKFLAGAGLQAASSAPVDTWSTNWCGSRHVHLCPQHVARTARLACAAPRGSRTAFFLFCFKAPSTRRRKKTGKRFGTLSCGHGAVRVRMKGM